MEDKHLLAGEPDLSVVDRAPWIELRHAYGPAVDVPEQFRALLSADPRSRQRALYSFYGNLFHQGSVYPATVAAIPVFQYLLRHEQVADRAMILELLTSFAVGFAEEQLENVDVATFVSAASEPDSEDDIEDESEPDSDSQECYLAVAAGAPLYELLLGDPDPQVVISAAFTLAFFPAHAFDSCHTLLEIARDPSRHALVRSSALIASSYLGGGSTPDLLRQTLADFIEGHKADDASATPYLVATAVYCVLREQERPENKTAGPFISPSRPLASDPRPLFQTLRSECEALAMRCLERGIETPACEFYRTRPKVDPARITPADVEELLLPQPQFPWGDLGARIARHASYRKPAVAKAPEEPRGPDPASFDVKPGHFDRDNVIAAVGRFHAHRWGFRTQGPGLLAEFEPFKPYAMLAWQECLQWLDSDEIEDRWAAARVIEEFEPLDETAVDQLIERLHRGDNNNLERVVTKQAVNQRQCQLLCDRLCNGEFVPSPTNSPRDAYRSIVLQHGTVEQIRRLFDEGQFKERAAAADELSRREEIEPAEVLPVFAESLASSDFGLRMSARYTFARWPTAHQWFLESYDVLAPALRWAIAEALSSARADLSEQQDALFTCIATETNPALASKLVDVVAGFESPQPGAVSRLIALCDEGSPALLRCAVVGTLGQWIGGDLDDLLKERLAAFAEDPSPRVRQAAIAALAKFPDRLPENLAILRRMLADDDPDNRRDALWQLSRRGALTATDVQVLLGQDQPDRVAAEALIAMALSRSAPLIDDDSSAALPLHNRPLTRSVWRWARRGRSTFEG